MLHFEVSTYNDASPPYRTHPKLQWAVNLHTFCVKVQWMNSLIAKQIDNNRFTCLKCFTTLSFTLYSISSLSLNQTHFLPIAMTSVVQLQSFLTACMHMLAAIIIIAFWEGRGAGSTLLVASFPKGFRWISGEGSCQGSVSCEQAVSVGNEEDPWSPSVVVSRVEWATGTGRLLPSESKSGMMDLICFLTNLSVRHSMSLPIPDFWTASSSLLSSPLPL